MVCDLPFGKMHGSEAGNAHLYPALLAEAGRVLRGGARCVLLTSDEMLPLLLAAVRGTRGALVMGARRRVPLGFTSAWICVAVRRGGPTDSESIHNLIHTPPTIDGASEAGDGEVVERFEWESSRGRSGWQVERLKSRLPMDPA